MKKIAMPISNGKLSEHFEKFDYFLLYDFENELCIKEEIKYPPAADMDSLMKWLHECGVGEIFVRGIAYQEIKKLNQNKIHVFVGVYKKNPEELIRDYMNKTLETDEKMYY